MMPSKIDLIESLYLKVYAREMKNSRNVSTTKKTAAYRGINVCMDIIMLQYGIL